MLQISAILSPFITIRPIYLLMPFFKYTSVASSSTTFINSSKPYSKEKKLGVCAELVSLGTSEKSSSTYNNFALYAQICILMQPYLYASLCLEELEDQELYKKEQFRLDKKHIGGRLEVSRI